MRKHQDVMFLPQWPAWKTLPMKRGVATRVDAPPALAAPAQKPHPRRPSQPPFVASRERPELRVCRLMGAVDSNQLRAAVFAPGARHGRVDPHVPAPAPRAAAQPVRAPHLLEHPLTIGLFLTFLPPLGLTLLWASPRLPMAGKIALTVLFGLMFLMLGVGAFFVLR